ncbi:MAG: head-tail connector protein, partial [Proteobacteria bacterium]|nr:head-tail connector protein [Pseudomonadota bacterium]
MSDAPTADRGVGGTAEARYRQLEPQRNIYLNRARECAKFTMPHLIRQHEGATQSDDIKTPWQALGARGVKNIAAKMLLLLLPPNDPFFKLQPDSMVLDQLPPGEDGKQQKTEMEKALGKIERSVQEDIEASSDRVVVDEALKHLVVAGNGLLHDTEYGLRFYHLDRYVCVRDPEGNVIETVSLEMVSPSALDQETLDAISQTQQYKDAFSKDRDSVERSLHIFTHVKLEGNMWTEYQECFGIKIPGSEATYPQDKCPWIVLRWSHLDGEDYGRSYVEEILGDLKSLETLWQAVVEGSVASARVLGLVHPNGTTSVKTLNEAKNGDFVEGTADDVDFLQLEKFADFQVAYKAIESLTERLSFAFMLNTAIQRNAERVTAEEIRYMAGELEDALGGAYAILSQEF